MPVLHMDTEAVRGVGTQLGQSAESLRQQGQQLRTITSHLAAEWDGGSADMFDAEMQILLQKLGQSAEVGGALHQRLEQEIQQWLWVANRLGQSSTGFNNLINKFGPDFLPVWSNVIEKTDLFPHTVSHLFQGQQYELITRYRSGEMSWDEMLDQLQDVNDSLAPEYLNKELTLYQIAQGQGEAGSSIWRDEWSGEYGDASVRAMSAEAKGNYDLKISGKGFEGKAQGEVGIYAVRGEYNGEIAGASVAVDGYIGAQAQGEASLVIGASGVTGAAGFSAFAGGRVDGSISKEGELGGVKAKGEARGSVSYGAGVKAEFEGGYQDGVVKYDVDIGATLGVGAEIGFSVELDVTGAVDNAVDAGKGAVNWGKQSVGNLGKGVLRFF